MGMTHEELKKQYQDYRDAARDMYQSDDGFTTIARDATVFTVSNGAYVEAIVWVPAEKLKKALANA